MDKTQEMVWRERRRKKILKKKPSEMMRGIWNNGDEWRDVTLIRFQKVIKKRKWIFERMIKYGN
jgi:hypothetical protein